MSPKDRRPLKDGLKTELEPEIDPQAARDFVYQDKAKIPETASMANPSPPARLPASTMNSANQSALVPLTARIPSEMFLALKRASFDRQLQGVEPNTMQDIVREVLTPWLRKHGYLP
jgi:hypothetical protein